MTIYYIYEITNDEYVALPADEQGPSDTPDGQIDIDTQDAWIPGSEEDLRVMLAEKAIDKWLSAN